MKGILKRLAPLLLFFGFITMQAFSQGRPLLVYDMDWRGELIITITLEEDIPCKQVIKNGQTKYYIDRISSYGIDMVTNNIPADIKYEAQVSTAVAPGASGGIFKLEDFTGKIIRPIASFAGISVIVSRYKYTSGQWSIEKNILTDIYVYIDNMKPKLELKYNPAKITSLETLRVSIDASDADIGLAAIPIKYRINDGQLVNIYSSSGEITLTNEGTYNLNISASDEFGNTATEAPTVIVDRTKPVISVSGLSPGSWINTRVALTLKATDDRSGVIEGSWYYSIDNTNYKQKVESNPWLPTLRGGTSIIHLYVQDNAGNMGEASVTWRYDGDTPAINVSGDMGENVWSGDASRTITVTASDSASGISVLETSLNNGPWIKEANAGSASFTYTGEGVFKRDIRATDAAGNIRTVTSYVNLDRHEPVISGFSFPSGWGNADYLFSGTRITDSTEAVASVSGVDPASFTVTPSGKNSIPVTSAYNAATGTLAPFSLGLSEGIYSLTLSAKDKAGNTASSVIQTIKIDNTAPQISASVDGIIIWKGNSWNIPIRTKILKEEHSGINPTGWKYRIDGGNTGTLILSSSGGEYSGDIVVPFLIGGNHSLTVIGNDNAGNEGSFQLSFKIDDVPPVISHDSLFAGAAEDAPWTNARTFTVSASDAGSDIREFTAEIRRGGAAGQWTVTGDAVFNGKSITFLEGIPGGIFQFKLKAIDNASNEKEEIFYARIDWAGPVIAIPSGLSGVNTVTASAQDALSGIAEESWEWREITGGAAGPWHTGKTGLLSEGKDRMISFRLKDKTGNWSEKSGEITIDLTPPEVSAEVPALAFRESLGIKISARDETTAVKRLWYYLDNDPQQELTWPAVQAVIPVKDYREGVHILRLIAEDSVLHKGQSEEYSFIIDRTEPEIETVDICSKLEPERLLGDLDFSGSSEVFIKVHGSDRYRDQEAYFPGDTIAWYWDSDQDKNTVPVFSESRKVLSPEFHITGLKEGPNYVYFRTEDAGGNFSAVFRRIVSVDLAIPAAPIIRSTTHSEARVVEQALPFSAAEFVFRPPVNIRSGIKRYQWRLEKMFIYGGIAGSGEIIDQGSTDKLSAALEGKLSLSLEDNREHEFYRIFVACTAANGNASGESVYQFRIDTASPNEVRVITSPQINQEEWHRDTSSLVMWNRPADMTGVAEFRYLITTDESLIPPGTSAEGSPPAEALLKEYDLSGWHKTSDTEFQADLRSYLNGKRSGVIHIAVCAIDYAGNRKLGRTSVKCDFIPPAFDSAGAEPLKIIDVDAEIGKAKHISWDKIIDGESGLDYITLLLLSDGDSATPAGGDRRIRPVILPPDTREFTLDHLEDSSVYTLQFIVSDRAGNQLVLHRLFATGNRELPSRFEVPYQETINGFELSGIRIIGGGDDEFEDIQLEIPAAIQIHEIKTINGKEERNRLHTIRLEEITVTENLPSSGKSGNGRYEASADGFTIEGGVFSFDREAGAALIESRYIRPIILDKMRQNATISIGRTGLGFPPVARFSSGTGALGGQAVIETLSAAPGGGEIPGFPLTRAESLRLATGKEWFYGSTISFDSSMLERHGIFLTGKEGKKEILITESRTEAESRNIRGNVTINSAEPLVLDIRGTVYTVKAAGVRGHYIDIYEAVLDLPESYEIQKLTVRNFIIDAQNGTVANGLDFAVDPVNTTAPNGGRFESVSAEFTPDGKLHVSGIITSDIYGDIQTSGLVLSNDGLNWDEGGAISGFTATVHGFPIVAIAARFSREGIFIERGEILHGDLRRQFINLGLTHLRSDDVFNNGTITDHYYLENNYGDPVLVKGGSIRNTGVFGIVVVPLGTVVEEISGGKSWEFPAVKFDPLGGMDGFYPGSDNIIIGGFEFTPGDIEFLGSHIRIGTLQSRSIPGMNPEILNFNDFCFTESAVLAAVPCSESPEYTIDGWTFAYDALALTVQGLRGAGALLLPEALGSFTVKFPESLILGSGSSGSEYRKRQGGRIRP